MPAEGFVKDSMLVRVIVIGLIVVALMVPVSMIGFLVYERETRRDEAVREIGAMWAAPQLLSGPILALPYRCDPPKGSPLAECLALLQVHPKTLTITGTLEPEVRTRSLFRAVVYKAKVKVTATFVPEARYANPAPVELLWSRATVNMGLSDPRGVTSAVELVSGDTRSKFVPGVAAGLHMMTGMKALVGNAPAAGNGEYHATFEFELNGTRDISFSDLGDNAVVRFESSWPHPSFIGSALPSTRTSESEGFTAEWRTGTFWRAAVASSALEDGSPRAVPTRAESPATFGVALITPVDVYQQTSRAVKYAVLFIGATFLVAFLWEVTRGVLVHPVQYGFVGFALCVFYLLLLSISEHAGFDPAYAIASAATVLQLSWYWRWVAGGRAQGGVMALILSGLYGFLYLLLRLEDYALLAGSVGLFVALIAVMFLTRKVNWHQLGKPPVSGT